MMKKLLLIIFLLALPLSFICSKGRVINKPYFLSRNNTQLEITKVTLTGKSTILDVQIYGNRGASINIEARAALIANGKQYKLLHKSGLPDTGYVKLADKMLPVKLYFEPLPADTPSFDLTENTPRGWVINNVYLDGTKPANSIPENIRQKKYDIQPLPKAEPKFGTMKITGHLYGIKDGAFPSVRYVIYDWVCYYFSPKSIPVQPDGSFEINDYLTCPGLKEIVFNRKHFYVFVVPGCHIEMNIDGTALTLAQTNLFGDEYRNKQLACFAGDYAQLNNELAIEPYNTEYTDMMSNIGTMSCKEFKEEVLALFHKQIQALQADRTISEPYRLLMSCMLKAKAFVTASSTRYIIGYTSLQPGEHRGDLTIGPDFFDDIYNIDGIDAPEMIFTGSGYKHITDVLGKVYAKSGKQVPQLWKDIEQAEKRFGQDLVKQEPLSDAQLSALDSISTPAIKEYVITKDKNNKEALNTAIPANALYSISHLDASIAGDKVLPSIIKPHAGCAILVDFWATWCGPCMRAMQSMKPVKEDLKSQAIDYVFITNNTSPLVLWQKTVPNIHGQHYRLNDEQWKTLMDTYRFQGIPAYLIIDRQGKVLYKHIGFPGEETMKKELMEAAK